MLISKKMNSALNKQIGYEFRAMLQYIAIAAHFAGEGLSQLSSHFYKQADEEHDHAMRFIKFILDAGGRAEIPEVPAPVCQFKKTEQAVKLSLDQEKEVTRLINSLVEMANKESDHITRSSLNWFLDEQLEEVSSMDTLLKVVQRAGETNLFYVEQYLAREKPENGPEENSGS